MDSLAVWLFPLPAQSSWDQSQTWALRAPILNKDLGYTGRRGDLSEEFLVREEKNREEPFLQTRSTRCLLSSTEHLNMEVLRGQTAGLQKNRSNMVRVFISSAFTDMSTERKALLDKAYPEVLTFCRGLGLVFEVVDLRWGIRNVPSADQGVLEVCLKEIEACKRLSVGPAFTVLLGNRYGHSPLPRLIPEKLFEVLSSKLSKNPQGQELLAHWFLRDENSVPPTYVLLPITTHFPHHGDLRPECKPERDRDVVAWRSTEIQISALLQQAAAWAEADGDITAQQKHHLHRSVTECEIEEGLWKEEGEPSALVFLREPPRQKPREGPRRLAKLMGMAADGLVDADGQALLTGLKSRLYTTAGKIVNPHCLELSKGSVDPKRKEHAQYLESVCQQFVSQMTSRISRMVDSATTDGQRRRLGGCEDDMDDGLSWVLDEVNCHAALSAELSRGLRGRESLLGKLGLAIWESTNIQHGPLVVHGEAGMGKTTLLCKMAQEMRNILDPRTVVVIRLLYDRHPLCPGLDHVLRSLSLQISLGYDMTPPGPLTTSTHTELVRFFQNLLVKVSQQGDTLLIILDSLDQISEENNAHRLHWLPTDIPPNVHLVVSMTTNTPMFANIRRKFEATGTFLEVDRLSRGEGRQIMDSYLRASQRTLTPEQGEVVLRSFEQSGSPFHLNLILSKAKHWRSSSPLSEVRLGLNAQDMMSLLFMSLEEKHGKKLVGCSLSYIAIARQGLLEVELRDVLSLDDDVIAEVYHFSAPPVPSMVRLPPLLWAQLRQDLGALLVERWLHGTALLGLCNRQLVEAVCERYLVAEQRVQRHRTLAEYFLGRWSQGKLKPIALPSSLLLLPDRKVPTQPLWFAPGSANIRKLQELPYQLLRAGLGEELREAVIGNAEWLYAKSSVCGLSSVIQDLSLCCRHLDCAESRLVRDTLVLMRPTLHFLQDATLFYTELLARLLSLAVPFPTIIGRLCSQCEAWLMSCPEPVMLPKSTFLKPPGGALTDVLTGFQEGVTCLDVCEDNGMLVAGSEDGMVMAWHLPQPEPLCTLLGHTAAILSVKMIDSGVHCLSLACDGSVRRWSLLTGRQVYCIDDAVPTGPAPHPSHTHLCLQKELVFVHTQTQVKGWRLDTAQCVLSVSDSGVVLGVLGDVFFSMSDSGLVRISQLSDHTQSLVTPLQSFQGGVTPVGTLTLPKHGRLLIFSKEGFLYQVSITGRQTGTEFPVVPSLLMVTEDEKILLAGSGRSLRLFHVERDSVEMFLDLQHEDDVLSASVSGDNRQLVSGAADHIIRVWSVATGLLLDSLCGSDAAVSSLVLSHGWLVSASPAANHVLLWSLKYEARARPKGRVPAGCPQAAITKDCDSVYYVSRRGQKEVVCWNNYTGCPSERLEVSADVCCLELAQHKRLLFCGLKTGTILIYPLDLPEETLCIPPPETLPSVRCLAIGPQERCIAAAYNDSVCLFEITARDSFPTVEGPVQRILLSLLQSPVSSMALLADGTLLYGTCCGEVRLHDFPKSKSSSLEAHATRVTCVTGSNWGGHALVGSEDGTQRLWSLKPLSLDHTMEYKSLNPEGVLCAAFAESDQFVFTGSEDRTVKAWDVATGRLLYVQYVYTPVFKMVTYRNGFLALSQQGYLIKEVFRCPEHVSPDYNPLRNVKGQYRVTSREKDQTGTQNTMTELHSFNPAQVNLSIMTMMASKSSSSACLIL